MEFKRAIEVKIIGYNMGEPVSSLIKIFYEKVTKKDIEEMVTEFNFGLPDIRVYQTHFEQILN